LPACDSGIIALKGLLNGPAALLGAEITLSAFSPTPRNDNRPQWRFVSVLEHIPNAKIDLVQQ
jgi:hypothetical protein